MKKTLLIIVSVGITLVLWLYMTASAHKYNVLVDDISSLQKSNLSSIISQSKSMNYRFSAIISDNQIKEDEYIKIATLLEEFRNIIEPFELLCFLNENETIFQQVFIAHKTADSSINLNPRTPTVSKVKKTIEALELFSQSIHLTQEKYF